MEHRLIENFLVKTKTAFINNDVSALKNISNEVLKHAVIKTDKHLAEVAVLGYALMKISSKNHIIKSRSWESAKNKIALHIDKTRLSLSDSNKLSFEKEVIRLHESVMAVDSQLGYYVMNTVAKARLKLASSAYALGLSLGSASDLTGADKKELMAYIGATTIHDEEHVEMTIAKRMKKFNNLLGA